jgi:hypothetical protein
MWPSFLIPVTVYFISVKHVLCNHLPYVTIFHCSLGKSHKTCLTILVWSLETSIVKWVCGELFWPVSQQVEINLIFTDNVVYYVYLAMSKSPKQLPYCLKRAETSIVLIIFNSVLYEKFKDSTNAVTVFFHPLYMNQVPEQLLFGQWSYITIHYTSQSHLTFQTELAQDKKVSDMQHQNLGQKPVKVRSSVPIV